MGLRYFNIYGPRQDPGGAYSAVIPHWVERMVSGEAVTINGSDAISRDFCFVEDVVQANVRAATAGDLSADIFNIASGREVTLGQLFTQIQQALQDLGEDYDHLPEVGDYRAGDIRRSAADITKACERLGFDPRFDLAKGLAATVARQAKSDR